VSGFTWLAGEGAPSRRPSDSLQIECDEAQLAVGIGNEEQR
jgi:hypothetical protein